MARCPAIAVFARSPVPGKVKTRLIPSLGGEGAARLHQALLSDTVRKVSRLSARISQHIFLTQSNPPARIAAPSFKVHIQRGRDLGRRIENALDDLFRLHAPVLIIGADSPLIAPAQFLLAFKELEMCDAVLGPCGDGGYYLIGLQRRAPGVLRGVRWGGRFAFRDTLRNLIRAGLSCSVLEEGSDVDTPRDFSRLATTLEESAAARRLAPETWKFVVRSRKSGLGLP
jgi:uncharacterized protein